jgi:hypothetical protein
VRPLSTIPGSRVGRNLPPRGEVPSRPTLTHCQSHAARWKRTHGIGFHATEYEGVDLPVGYPSLMKSADHANSKVSNKFGESQNPKKLG